MMVDDTLKDALTDFANEMAELIKRQTIDTLQEKLGVKIVVRERRPRPVKVRPKAVTATRGAPKGTFGARVKKFRKQYNFTQQALADNLGLQRGALANLENNRWNPSPDRKQSIEKAISAMEMQLPKSP